MAKAYTPRTNRRKLPPINHVVNDWSSGYMSYADAIRARKNALSDMTNMDLVQNGIPKIRPGTVKYGSQPLGLVIGIGTFIKAVDSSQPENYEIFMQVIDGVGKIVIRKNGGSMTVIGGNYNTTAWCTFTQSNNRVYVSNGVDKMSYYNIKTNTIVTYAAISKPNTPSVVATGLTGTVVTYRVRVSANNNVGETEASAAFLITVGAFREEWNPSSQYITITVPQVTGADSYNFYIGLTAGEEQYLGNVVKPANPGDNVVFKDNNRASLNPFKKAPEGNSTSGPILTNLIESDGQLFGTGDKDNRYRYWYSGTGDKSGDFSPFNGGGWVDINYGGKNIPTSVHAFRNGKGDSAITILTRGIAGKGALYHQTFENQTLGDFTITYPVIKQANGSSGTYSPMAVVESNNSLHYPSGKSFKTTGTKAQMVNILVNDNIADTIAPDVSRLNLAAMHKAVGLEVDGRIFWCLPVGSNKNNEIWVFDIPKKGAWILRWTLPCDYMWLYEDEAGKTHHCVLSNNKILEFDKAAASTDDGEPFKTRLAGTTLTFDETSLQMASVETKRFSLIRPRGDINFKISGLGEDAEAITGLASERINPGTLPTGWSDAEWSAEEFSYELPPAEILSKQLVPVPIDVDEIVCQLNWEITTETAGCDYTLHGEKTDGKIIPNLFYGDD